MRRRVVVAMESHKGGTLIGWLVVDEETNG